MNKLIKLELGQKVIIDKSLEGEVVANIDFNLYSDEFPKNQWDYLESGVLINTQACGLLYYSNIPEIIDFI